MLDNELKTELEGLHAKLAKEAGLVKELAEKAKAVAEAADGKLDEALKNKRVRGLSIGYETRKSRPDDKRAGVTHLDEIHLWEVSVVNFPMNRRSLVLDAKATDPAQWWELHDRLREFDESADASSEIKKEIELLLQIEACPKSLRPFFAKRLVSGGRGEPGRQPHRSESEGTKSAVETLRAFTAGIGG